MLPLLSATRFKNDNNEELVVSSPDGQIHIINIAGDVLCLDLGEPIHAFCIGLLNSAFSTYEPFDICSTLDGTIDSPPYQSSNDNLASTLEDRLSLVFISSITNKMCFVSVESLFKMGSNGRELNYKFENVFTKLKSANNMELNKALANSSRPSARAVLKNLIYNYGSNSAEVQFSNEEQQIR